MTVIGARFDLEQDMDFLTEQQTQQLYQLFSVIDADELMAFVEGLESKQE